MVKFLILGLFAKHLTSEPRGAGVLGSGFAEYVPLAGRTESFAHYSSLFRSRNMCNVVKRCMISFPRNLLLLQIQREINM